MLWNFRWHLPRLYIRYVRFKVYFGAGNPPCSVRWVSHRHFVNGKDLATWVIDLHTEACPLPLAGRPSTRLRDTRMHSLMPLRPGPFWHRVTSFTYNCKRSHIKPLGNVRLLILPNTKRVQYMTYKCNRNNLDINKMMLTETTHTPSWNQAVNVDAWHRANVMIRREVYLYSDSLVNTQTITTRDSASNTRVFCAVYQHWSI